MTTPSVHNLTMRTFDRPAETTDDDAKALAARARFLLGIGRDQAERLVDDLLDVLAHRHTTRRS
jgi:hypothetical protein